MILSSADQLTGRPVRIVSLVPSQTELLYHLGLEAETIAITKFCIHPSHWFNNKTRIGGTKAIDIEKIISLNPDLVIANKEENIKEQVELLAEKFPVWVSDVNDLNGAYEMIADIGKLTGSIESALELIQQVKNKFQINLEKIPISDRISIAYLIWRNPYMTIGADTFISNMLLSAGFSNTFGHTKRYPEISLTDIKNSGCRAVFLSSEPYPFQQKHIDELREQLPGIKIILVDGEMFSWYGSRLLQAPAYLAQLHNTIKSES